MFVAPLLRCLQSFAMSTIPLDDKLTLGRFRWADAVAGAVCYPDGQIYSLDSFAVGSAIPSPSPSGRSESMSAVAVGSSFFGPSLVTSSSFRSTFHAAGAAHGCLLGLGGQFV